MKKNIGSTIALVIGILAIVSGLSNLTNTSNTLISGIIITLGTLAYRSAKKRKLGGINPSLLRQALEIFAIVIIIALILLKKNLKNNIITEPVQTLIIPLWAIFAYLNIAFKNIKIL